LAPLIPTSTKISSSSKAQHFLVGVNLGALDLAVDRLVLFIAVVVSGFAEKVDATHYFRSAKNRGQRGMALT